MRCHAFFARCCAALPIAVVLVLAAFSQLPGDQGSRVVVLTRKGMTSLELTDEEATFGPRIPPGGVAGTLRLAVPIEGCERLKNKYDGPWIALLKRGGTDPSCSFVTKVRPTRAPGWSRDTPADEDSRRAHGVERDVLFFSLFFSPFSARTNARTKRANESFLFLQALLQAPDTNETHFLYKIRCATRSTPARSRRSSTTTATPR
jgi:hypothetical protein